MLDCVRRCAHGRGVAAEACYDVPVVVRQFGPEFGVDDHRGLIGKCEKYDVSYGCPSLTCDVCDDCCSQMCVRELGRQGRQM